MDKRRALCIEGEPATAALIAQSLEPFGFEVEVMDDGNEGIARAKEYAPEIIVLCVELPGANGFSVCNKLKKAPETRTIPVILTSDAGPDAFESHRRLKTHADEYLVKPFSTEELLEKADALVGLGAPAASDGVVETEEISLGEGEYLMEEEAEPAADGEEHVVPFEEPGYETEDPPAYAAAPSEADHLAAAASAARISELEAENARLRHDLDSAVPTPRPPTEGSRVAELESEVERLKGEVDRLSADAERLRADAERARHTPPPAPSSPRIGELEDEVERLKQELDHAKAAPKDSAFSRDKDLLSLREVIARKEKEILDLRDSLDAKDRHVLDQKDRVRAAERKVSESEEKLLPLERELVQAREERQAAIENEEKSHEREKAIKGRLEEAKAEVAKAHAENEELRAQKKQEAEARDAVHREEIEAVTRRMKADMATVEQLREQALAEAKAAGEATERRFREESAEIEQKHAVALESVGRREADARAGMDQRHKGELDDARGRAGEIERQLAEVQRVLSGREAQVSELEQSNAAFQDQLLRATVRLKGNEQATERARKALAIALTLLDSGGETPGSETDSADRT